MCICPKRKLDRSGMTASRLSIQIRRLPRLVTLQSASIVPNRKSRFATSQIRFAVNAARPAIGRTGQRRERSQPGKANQRLIEAPVVFDSLQPHPVIDAVQDVALAQKPRDKIVVGEVSVERMPAGKQAFPQKQICEKSQEQNLNP